MTRKKIFALLICAALSLTLTGCGNGKVGDAVSETASRLGEGVSNTMSRVESAVESFFEPESSREDDTLSSAGSDLHDESSLSSPAGSGMDSDADSGISSEESSLASNKAR